jgi:hypothetical protein
MKNEAVEIVAASFYYWDFDASDDTSERQNSNTTTAPEANKIAASRGGSGGYEVERETGFEPATFSLGS